MSLRQSLEAKTVKALAGAKVYSRGADYYAERRVIVTASAPEQVEATVRGNRRYRVKLWRDGGELYWECSCPAADDGAFCKHAVAVACGVIDRAWGFDTTDTAADIAAGATSTPKRDLGAYVASLPHERLVEIVVAAAADDWRLGERLAAEMRSTHGDPVDLREWKRRYDGAIDHTGRDGFVDYYNAEGWADGVTTVIDATEELFESDGGDTNARAIVDLVEYVLDRLDDAQQFVDDSDGWTAGLVERLADLHHAACAAAGFDPIELARRWHALESTTSDLEPFYGAAMTYADILGDAGSAEMQQLASAKWEAMEPPAPGQWSSEWSRLQHRMVDGAKRRGDVDELIAVHGRDLSNARAYTDIIEALRDARRNDEAIEWAERGLAHDGHRIARGEIRELLAQLLTARGDGDRAGELFWDAFTKRPTLASYQRWLEAAGHGRKAAIERALDWLGPKAAAAVTAERSRRRSVPSMLAFSPEPVGTLVEVLLAEGRVDDAWDTARRLDYAGPLSMRLAEAREPGHPLDAVDIYEPVVFQRINAMTNDSYANAVQLMARIRSLCDQANAPERFGALLTKVRTTHKAKRNLKKLLDKKGWD